MSEIKKENPLEMLPINKLLVKFSVPSIIAMLVTALYNIVDQFFIGQAVGSLGNAATSISFPLSITCIAETLPRIKNRQKSAIRQDITIPV